MVMATSAGSIAAAVPGVDHLSVFTSSCAAVHALFTPLHLLAVDVS